MWNRIKDVSGVLATIFAGLAIITATSSGSALSNAQSYIPDWVIRHSGMLAWLFSYLSFGLWAWLRHRAYEQGFTKKTLVHVSEHENKNQKVAADTWLQHAVFYVAFGKWPDPSKPVFELPNPQVPTEENIELLDTLKDMLRWPRLFGQIFRFDKWNLCRC
jgi:hypothetical protein